MAKLRTGVGHTYKIAVSKYIKESTSGGGGGRVGGQCGCERRIVVFMKIQKKKIWGGGRGVGGGGVRVDVIEELKFLGKFTNKNRKGGREGSGGGRGGGRVGGGGAVRVDVNEELKFL